METEKKEPVLKWLAPSDRFRTSFDIASLGSKAFESYASLSEQANKAALASFEGDHQKLSSYRIKINPIVYPTQVSVCPTVEVIKDRLFLDNLIVSVHSLDGYEFSSEYTHVYKGVYNKLTVYDDLSAVIRRAIRVFEPSMIEVNCLKYSEYVMRTAAWESHLAQLVAAETIKTVVPGVEILSKWKDTDFSHIKVYIGKNESGELCFTVRTQVQLEIAEPAPKDEKKMTKPTPIPISFMYYREFLLNKATLDEFEQITFVNPKNNMKKNDKVNFVPPPPPSRAKKGSSSADADDIRLFLMLGKSPEEIAVLVAAEALKKKEEGERLAAAAAAAEKEKNLEATTTDTDEESVRLQKKKLQEKAEKATAAAATRKSTSASSAVIPMNQSSYCSEVMIWGFNSCNSFGLPYDEGAAPPASSSSTNGGAGAADGVANKYDHLERVIEPQPISIPYSLAIERISMIACSSNHTLALTHLGAIYSCGDNSEGALGLGDNFSRDTLTFLDWPLATYSVPPKITKISAGCSNIGAHSMAIDVEGRLYGWGVSYAVGRGEIKPITSPAVVELLPTIGSSSGIGGTDTDSVTGDESEIESATTARSDRVDQKVVDVSCGGGYTVCVTRSGHVFAWGTWAHGRLGLGPVPMIEQPRTVRKRAVKKLARYQLRPKMVEGIHTAVKAVCGEAHTLCLLSCGSLLSWGQNSCGQVGVGPTFTGYLCDAFHPVLVAPFINHATVEKKYLTQFEMKSPCTGYLAALETSRSTSDMVASDIAVGAFHSVVKTTRHGVYSWGGRGSPCLGHNDQEILGEWSTKINLIFSIATTESKTMVPHELWEWCCVWSLPRVIESLNGIAVEQLACGDLHSSFLSSTGRVYLCGSGPVVPGIISTSKILEDNEQRELQQRMVDLALKEKNKDEGLSQASHLSKDSSKILKGVRLAEQQARLASLVSSPRCPSSCWLVELCTRHIAYIASGACKMFAIVDADSVSASLTNSLLDRLNASGGVSNGHEKDDDMSLASSISDSASKIESIFENRGKADCMILASGKVFLCHKALLAARSAELRDMIAMETPIDSSFSQPVQILLPELQRDSARVLLHFLYCDTLPKWCIHNTSLLRTLMRAAQTLRIPRLQLLCERFIKLIHATTKVGPNESGDVSRIISDLSYTSQLDMPPCTLARDLGSMVGDPEFADVRFIAEGRAIVAHRFVLESRCEYFRAMFRSGLGENAVANKGMVDVVVPDSFVGFLRLLLFIYTDSLPDGSDGALLEDLMAADRYDVQDMKVLCENMLVPSQSNWMDLLRAADLLGSRRLHLLVISYLRDNLTKLSAGSGTMADKSNSSSTSSAEITGETDPLVVELMSEFPEVYAEVMALRRGISPAPPCTLLINQFIANSKGNEAVKNKKNTFPFWALIMAAVCLAMYQNLSKYVPLGWVVPIVNVTGVVVIVLIAYNSYNGV